MKIPAILLATVAIAQEDYVAAVIDYDATAADYDATAADYDAAVTAVVDYTDNDSVSVDYNGTDGIDAFERRGNKNKNQNKNQAPAANYQAPAANYQAPAANYQAPAANYQAPAANYQAPAENYQAPAYGAPAYKTPLKCWHCDAMSFDECAYKGQEKTCLGHAESCFLEIRERRDGRPFKQICMGCKQTEACKNMQNQNFQNQNPDYTQCRPETYYPESVCRQCCATDNCTKEPSWWYPTTRQEWSYTGDEDSYDNNAGY